MEKPIIFSAPMVRAILECRKTQTRRVLKPQPTAGHRIYQSLDGLWMENAPDEPGGELAPAYSIKGLRFWPGDLLWVRETWVRCTGCNPPPGVIYRADGTPSAHKWRSPIHMPRWASRITLRVMDVRVQRVQEISGGDAVAEGVIAPIVGGTREQACALDAFMRLWDSIHVKHPERQWSANPWVVALTFERVT